LQCIWSEVPNAVPRGPEPPPVERKETSQDVVGDQNPRRRLETLGHAAGEVPLRKRAWQALVTRAQYADPAVVYEKAARMKDDGTHGRPSRYLHGHQRGPPGHRRGQDIDTADCLGDPLLDDRPAWIVVVQQFVKRPLLGAHRTVGLTLRSAAKPPRHDGSNVRVSWLRSSSARNATDVHLRHLAASTRVPTMLVTNPRRISTSVTAPPRLLPVKGKRSDGASGPGPGHQRMEVIGKRNPRSQSCAQLPIGPWATQRQLRHRRAGNAAGRGR